MRLCFISDTHNQHDKVLVPDGDVLIHCGDATIGGTIEELAPFAEWLTDLPHKKKVFVPGNHDLLFRDNPTLALSIMGKDVSVVTHDVLTYRGVRFFLSSFSPEFGHKWAFHYRRGEEAARLWDQIPFNTEVLVTHGPPLGIMDLTSARWESKSAGCRELTQRVLQLHRYGSLRVHAFGHIHAGHGLERWDTQDAGPITFVNAAICDDDYNVAFQPETVDL